jgi:hypothetical protein
MPDPVVPTPIADYSGETPNPSNPATYGIHGRNLWAWEIGTLLPGANLLADQAYTNALAANEAAVLAYLNANYKGAWSGLTGPLSMPALVSHAGERWALLNSLANVATSTPGVSADWELFELPSAAGVGFDPSGTTRTETNVQTMLTALANDTDEALIDFENPVLNGDMRVAQTGTSFSCAAGLTKVIDGFACGIAGAAVLTVSQQAASTPVNPNAKWLIATVATPDTSLASTDYSWLIANVEGYDVAAYVGQTFTIGFWVKSSVAGVHSVALLNSGLDRSFIGEFNILSVNTPQFVSITVPNGLPADGAWNFTNGIGLQLSFLLSAGSFFHGAAGSWLTNSKIATASQVNAVGTIGNVFGITDVQINPGSVAKQFKRLSYESSLSRCQRYYERVSYYMLDADLNGGKGSVGNMGFFKATKRAGVVLTPSVDGSLFGGDSLTYPGFEAKTGGFAQTTPGVFNAHVGQPRDGLFLVITADSRL